MASGKYSEYIEGFTGHSNKFFDIEEIHKNRRETSAYMSLFVYDSEALDYLKDNWVIPEDKTKEKYKSINGYRGGVLANYIWLDIDDEKNFDKAVERARDVVTRMNTRYDLKFESMAIYFSGMKGFSIGVPTSLFGAKDFKHDMLPAVFKLMAEDMIGSKEFDPTIYEHTRIWRIPNSKHGKTGLYKTEIDYKLLLELNAVKIKVLAGDNKVEKSYKFIGEHCEKLKVLFTNCLEQVEKKRETVDGSTMSGTLYDNQTVFKIIPKGEQSRNVAFHKAAYRLFAIPNLKTEEAIDIMKFVAEMYHIHADKENVDRMTQVEINASIKSAYERTRAFKKSNYTVTNMQGMIANVYQMIKNARYVPTKITDFDSDMRGGLELSNLYAMIGKGGTMKSILMQDIHIEYSMHSKKNSVYINGEMAEKLFFERAFYKMFGFSFIEAIDNGIVNESTIEKYNYDINTKIMNTMFVVSQTDLETKDIQSIIMDKQDEIKEPIDLCTIDSMNSMRFIDSEATTAFKTTKYLKEVAKDTNTAIALINHANNACPDTMRDCSPFCRGGSKPIDNCDAYFSLSRIVDKDRSKNLQDITNKNIIYLAGMVYIRLVNKRGTGNTISKVMKIDNLFNLTDSLLIPDECEIY